MRNRVVPTLEPHGSFLARANLADFLVRQLDDTTWVRKAPMICDSGVQ
jgi:hypothetical protein